jgi:hypothetical protein
MYQLDIQKIDSNFSLTDSKTEAAVLHYLWNVVQNIPVEDYLKDAAQDENVSTTLAYLRLAAFVPFFLGASDIVWEYDDGSDRIYSFYDNLKERVIDDTLILPHTLNVIKNCLQKKGLINKSDFDGTIEDKDVYEHEKWSFFCDLADGFSVRKYLIKSVGINTLTMLFSNIGNSTDAQNLADSIYAPETADDDIEDEDDDDFYDEDYRHEFESPDDFVEFLVEHTDELIPIAPTYIQCHLYSFLNGDSD